MTREQIAALSEQLRDIAQYAINLSDAARTTCGEAADAILALHQQPAAAQSVTADQRREQIAKAIYALDPYQESGEYVDGFAVSPGGALTWEQARDRDAEFADVRGSLPPITKFAYDAADAALTALQWQASGWIVANANEDRFRMWGDTGPEWTDERRKAILFARRDDAEAFARDDEDAWKILPQNVIRARSADEDEVYELGKRDGYEEAIQELDIATGGDGEFKGSTIPGATVDVPAMKRRIIGRLAQPVTADDGLDVNTIGRETVANWMMLRGYATGHGDTIQDLLFELEAQAKEHGGP